MSDTAVHEIYVVVGGCGFYSDRREWCVAWFASEAEAEAFARVAAAESKKIDARARALIRPEWKYGYGPEDAANDPAQVKYRADKTAIYAGNPYDREYSEGEVNDYVVCAVPEAVWRLAVK